MLIQLLLVLHPRHKFQYFKNAGWEEAWITTAQSIVRDEYDHTYAFMDIGDTLSNEVRLLIISTTYL